MAKPTAQAEQAGVLHLPAGIAERRVLKRGEALDVRFDVATPGLVIVVAAAGSWEDDGLLPRPRDGDRVPHRLELFPPGDGNATAEEVSEAPEAHLVHELAPGAFTPGPWVARLTNLATRGETFGLYVSYPSERELQSVELAADAFAELAAIALELRHGHQSSSLTLNTPAGPMSHYFTVEDIEYSCPWTPRVLVYFDALRSTTVGLSVPEDTPDPVLRFELGFDDEGIEINGTIPLNLSDIRLTVDLPIIVRYNRASGSTTLSGIDYEPADVRATFAFEPMFDEIVEWLPGFFPRWRRLIQRTVEKACRDLLSSEEMRGVFSDALQARVLAEIGADARPVGVAPADGRLRVSYYTY